MRLDPTITVEQWRQLLTEEAVRTWGQQRAEALARPLEQIAAAIHGVCNFPLDPEVEPYLLSAEPLPPEDV